MCNVVIGRDKRYNTPQTTEQDSSRLFIRRSVFASAKLLTKPALLLASAIIIIAMLAITKAMFWVFIVATGVIILPFSAIVMWLNYTDWHDEYYQVDSRGDLVVGYRTLFKYRSTRRGPIRSLQDAYVVQRGLFKLMFGYGDVYVQVGWSRYPFVLRDVQEPYVIAKRLKELSKAARDGNEPRSAVAATLRKRK